MSDDDETAAECGICARRCDAGRTLCGRCSAAFGDDLAEIAERYARLDATPGRADPGGRGAPGFRSSPPGSVHVMAMRDPRSLPYALAADDDRRPPRSVQAALLGLAMRVRAQRGLSQGPPRTVPELADWLGRHDDWLSRDPLGVEAAREVRILRAQLRPVTGDPAPRPIGHCLEDGCSAPIFMPPDAAPRAPDEPVRDMPALVCPRCRSEYDGRRLIVLRLVEEASAA